MRIWSVDAFLEVIPGKVIPVPQTYLIDSVVNVLNAQFSHPPDLLELAVDHHSIRVAGHSSLLGEGILLSLLGHQESNRLFDVLQSQLFNVA